MWKPYHCTPSQRCISLPAELASLDDVGIKGIDLRYRHSGRKDSHDNEFRYISKVLMQDGTTRAISDVFVTKK